MGFVSGLFLNDKFTSSLLAKIKGADEESVKKKEEKIEDIIEERDETKPLTVEEIDKENPGKKTPFKIKSVTPKQPFKVIYSSPKPSEFDVSDFSKDDEKNIESSISKK